MRDTASLCAALTVSLSCSNGDDPKAKEVDAHDEVLEVSLAVETAGSLPECTKALQGTTALVASPLGLYACNDGSWALVRCTDELAGTVAYASSSQTLVACVSGSWVEVRAPSDTPGAAGAPGQAGSGGSGGTSTEPEPDGSGGTSTEPEPDGSGGTSTEPEPSEGFCGDGVVDADDGEECDAEGVTTASCDLDCTLPTCGDGFVNHMAGEECDGNSAGCSSTCVIAPTPPPPAKWEVGVTEIMANPSGTDTGREWFELGSGSADTVYHLDWCVVRTGNGEFVIPPGTSIHPGEYLTFASGPDPGFVPTYNYESAFVMDNRDGWLLLECYSNEIYSLTYTRAPEGETLGTSGPGFTISSPSQNFDFLELECPQMTYGDGTNYGTPNAMNCP